MGGFRLREPTGLREQLCSCLITLLFRLISEPLFILEVGTAESSPGTLYLASGRKLLVEGGNHFPYKNSLGTWTELGDGPSVRLQASRPQGHRGAADPPWAPCLDLRVRRMKTTASEISRGW